MKLPDLEQRLQAWSPRFSPGLFKASLIALVAAAFVIPLAVVALPFLEILNDMAVQPKGKAQGLHGRLQGQALTVERLPPAGAIPMGYYPYHIEGATPESAELAGRTLANPLERTMAVLEQGRKVYETTCITCHGPSGNGDGPIVGPGLFPAPTSLNTDAVRAFPDGRIYHVITRGQNKMPSYADKLVPEERWAVIHFVRALQRSQNPEPEDLAK